MNDNTLKKITMPKSKPLVVLIFSLAIMGVIGFGGLMYALYLMLVHYKPLMAW